MVEKDNIKELFAQKLAQHEVPVNPGLWEGIASQVGATTVVGGGLSLGAKIAIGLGAAASITGGILFFNNDSQKTEQQQIVVQSGVPSSAQETIIENTTEFNKLESVSQLEKRVESNESPAEMLVHSNKITESVENTNALSEESIIRPLKIEKTVLKETEQQVDSISETPTNVETAEVAFEVDKEIEELSVEVEEPEVLAQITKVPNIFTPNGDRDNDEFFIEYSGELEDYHLVIMDAHNHVMYQTSNPDFRWNGNTLQGDPVNEGTYYFILTSRDKNQNPINKYGQITVRR